MPGCVGPSSTPFALHEIPIPHCLEVLRPKTYSNPALSLLRTDLFGVLVLIPLLSRVLLAARGVSTPCALLMLCESSLVCGSWASPGRRGVCCGASAQALKMPQQLCRGLVPWRCQQYPVQLSCGDLILCPSCRREGICLAEEGAGGGRGLLQRSGGGSCGRSLVRCSERGWHHLSGKGRQKVLGQSWARRLCMEQGKD